MRAEPASSSEVVPVRLETRKSELVLCPTPPRRPLAQVQQDVIVRQLPTWSRRAKRLMDIVGSSTLLLLASPVLVAIYLALKASSRAPAVFTQQRCGVGGVPFRFFKFRTMVVDAEARKASLSHLNEVTGPAFKLRNDPRVTKLGSFLRGTSLDELPQLWNVLRGEMSLVGPRPPTVDEVEMYSSAQTRRLSVLPGITGLWQTSGRSNLSHFDRWLELDVEYAERWSLGMDIWLLIKTPYVVLLRIGAR